MTVVSDRTYNDDGKQTKNKHTNKKQANKQTDRQTKEIDGEAIGPKSSVCLGQAGTSKRSAYYNFLFSARTKGK